MLKLKTKLVVVCSLQLLFFGFYVLLYPSSLQKVTLLHTGRRLSLNSSDSRSQTQGPQKVRGAAADFVASADVREKGSHAEEREAAEQNSGKNEVQGAVPGNKNGEHLQPIVMEEDKRKHEDENMKFVHEGAVAGNGNEEHHQHRMEENIEKYKHEDMNFVPEEVIDFTPADFVEVKKTVTKKVKVSREGRKLTPAEEKYRSRLVPDPHMKPEVLRKRFESIKASGKNPELVAFVEEQEYRKARVRKECNGPDSVAVAQQGDNMGPPKSLSFRNIVLDRRDSSFSNIDYLLRPQPSSLVEAAQLEQRREGRLRALLRSIKHGAGTLLFAAYQRLIVDKKNYLTFCPVYKAASTSWSTNLLLLNDAWDETEGFELQSVLHVVFPKISNLAGPMMTEGTTRFLVVRHPFERLVSCYRDKFENAIRDFYYKRYGETMIRRFRSVPHTTSHEADILLKQVRGHIHNTIAVPEEAMHDNPYAHPIGPTFTEFIKFVVTCRQDDEHWRPYDLHCSLCYIDYDFILKFENMYDEGRHFITYINQTEKIKLRWDNPSAEGATTTNVSHKYFKQLPTHLIELLIMKYKKDFDLFEYSPEEYLELASDIGHEEDMNI